MELACALLFVLAWLAMAGYMNYKIWRKPDDVWRMQEQERAIPPGSNAGLFRRFLHFDPLALGQNRGRFIWFERAVAALVLLIGMAMLVGLIGQLVAVSY